MSSNEIAALTQSAFAEGFKEGESYILEKLKAEIHRLAFDDDDGDYMGLIDDDEVMELIDKYISELKGER